MPSTSPYGCRRGPRPPPGGRGPPEAGIPKGSAKPNLEFVADLPFDKVVGIARSKISGSYAKSLRSAVKEVVGSCVSMGVKVEGTDPREFMKQIEGGKWDAKLA